ncbi:MAG: M14 family zinc carboxypeptidase [Candidatus Aminicenantes bacterium]
MKLKNFPFCIICIFFLINLVVYSHPANIPDPETFFGHKPGADFKLIRWEKIYEYFQLLGKNSDRIKIEELGKTTMGNPFILAIISSPENLSNLAKYKDIGGKLAKGRISEEEADRLAKEGKTIALITCSMHASECGPTQMSPELGYVLAADDSPQIQNILENVILLLVPSWNPDGNILTTDWYHENLGTPYETVPMPWLYHHYTGHDNNRDAFMHTQVETRYVNDILYHEWFPQIFMDMHHMGNSTARLFLSPLYDPRHHSLDPLLTREIELTGAHMRTLLEEEGKIGVMHYALWNHWRMSAIHTCALWHNVATILFEAAGTRMATPVLQEPRYLTDPGRRQLGTQGNTQSQNYPSPWPGGWWRLRDIVEYAFASSVGFLEAGALHRNRYLLNMYRMARNSIEKGKTEAPYAYIIRWDQKDPNTVAKMIDILISGGIDVHQAEEPFRAQNRDYPAGAYVVLLSQAYRPYIIDILGPQIYPDRRQYEGGPPESTFDLTGWTLPYQMGVDAVRVDFPFEARLRSIERAEFPAGEVRGSGDTYILDHRVLDSYRAVNRLLEAGVDVAWAAESFSSRGKTYPAGAVIVSGPGLQKAIEALAEEFSLRIDAGHYPGKQMPLKPLRLGLYQPWTANMDEGWTRWIFDTWEFPYTTVHDAEIRSGSLREKYDVILLTNISSRDIIEGHSKGTVPSRYAGGIGKHGLAELRRFAADGGTLITLNAACRLPMDHFRVPLRDVSGSYPSTEFFCPSAILRAEVDTTHPIGYGMEPSANLLFYGSPVFEFIEKDPQVPAAGDTHPDSWNVVARYPEGSPFMSGRLIGDHVLHNKPALVDFDYGKGRIIMFGFRPQNRAQPHGTFMMFFNALYYGPAAASGD